MSLRFFSVAILVCTSLFSSHTFAALKRYNFPNNSAFSHVFNSRDAAGCPTGVGGTAVYPNHAATGERLCDQEALRQGINPAYMIWYASPVFGTWDSPGDNRLCKYNGSQMQLVNGTQSGGKWTNVVVCEYKPFDCGVRWSYQLQRAGLDWQLNWTRINAGRDFANVNGTRFVCAPRTCTAATCPDTPAAGRDECFLTDKPGEYRRLNGTLCACPASKEKVGNQCVADQCTNIAGFQATVPTTTNRNAAGNCLCKNGGTNPATCTPPVVPPASVACNDGIDNDTDGLIDFPADPGCTSATDTSEDNAALAQCSDGLDNDGDGKIDFICPAAGTTYTPEQSKGRESASFTAAQGLFEEMAPSGQAKRPTLISSKVNPGDKVKIVSVSNNKFSISVGKPSADRTCDYGSISFVNANEKTLDSRQFRNINSNGIIAPPGTNRAFVSFDDNPQQYSDNSGYNGNNGYNPCQVTIEVFSPAVGTPGATATTCTPDPDCTSATDDTESGDLVCPAGTTRKPTPESPVCFLTATPTTSPAGTSFSLTGYSHLTGTCTLASATTHDVPSKVISPLVSLGLSVSPSVSHITAVTESTFSSPTQVASLLTCPHGSAACSIGTGGIISCGCYNPGITPPVIVVPPIYTCESNLCAEGQYFCSAENMCKPAGQPCSAITCDQDNVCEVGESCNCGDCTQGNLLNDKDQCGVGTSGEQLYCTKDSVVASNTTFPFCLPACLDGQACTTTCKQQVGACCPAGSQWSSAADSCVPATCGKGEFYCAAQKKCLPGGTTCDTAVCNNDGTCSGEESCQCADCVNGGSDDKDKCSIIGGIQAMCSDDNLTDGKPGACCVPPEKWDSTANGGAGACLACSNTQAPAELKANYDQPYITCTGNGVVADTHFRYMIKQGTTVVMTSDIYPNSTQVLHPKMSEGVYTVQCFYGNATTVNTTGTATPHTCEKTMTVKADNANTIQGCNRVYAYKGLTLSDELTSNSSFDASFRCGARLTSVDTPNPFALHIGTIAPQFLIVDTFMTSFLGEFDPPIGALSTQTQNHRFNTGSTPVACAVRVGGGYSTNDYCRATACVGDNCNVPQAFSVVHSGDAVCTTAQTDTYNIGCNPEAPDDIRTQCVEMFQSAVTAAGSSASNGTPFTLSFSFNGVQRFIECAKYAAGSPELHNIYDTVSCKAPLDNGEYYDIYAADVNGNKINSLQTQTRTVQRDNDLPKLDPIKYYTDSSLTTEVTPGTWSSEPVTAVAVCRDAPTTESASCACAQFVDDLTTNKPEWTRGVYHGTVDIGADLLRYTRVISERIVDQDVVVVDTAGNKSTPTQKISASIDADAPVMSISESGTGATRDVILTATDNVSKIWKTTAAPSGATNTSGIIWRKGLKANLASLTFDEECGVTPSFATVSETGAASFPITATVTIPAVNMTTEVVTYCIRDNAGNTTRGIYPVVTDACFSATNMSPIPTFGNYKNFLTTRLGGSGTDNQKYGYSFSENQSNAACFRGILATNIQTLVANQLEPRTTTTLTNWDTDRAPTKANTSVLNTNGYYYYKYSGNTLNLRTSPSPTDTGTKSVIVDGGDIHIKENINYSGPGKTLLLIARRNVTGQGGNIIIDTTVTNIDAILIADGGALKSSNASAPGDRLTINGRIYSYNTRGGSLQPSGTTDLINATTPQIFSASGSLITAPSLADAQMQDLERLRPSFVGESTCSLYLNYYAYTTATLPLLLQKPVGYTGGNCGF